MFPQQYSNDREKGVGASRCSSVLNFGKMRISFNFHSANNKHLLTIGSSYDNNLCASEAKIAFPNVTC